MSIYVSDFEYRCCGFESATRPIEPPWRTLAALLLLAGGCLLRCAPRRAVPSKHSPLGGQRSTRSDKRGGYITALPAHAMTAHSGAFNRGR